MLERIGIYITLLIILIFEAILSVFPQISPSENIVIFLLALSFISIFAYFDKTYGKRIKANSNGIKIEDTLSIAISSVIKTEKRNHNEIRTLDLFAFTGKRYCQILGEVLGRNTSGIKVRVLIVDPEKLKNFKCNSIVDLISEVNSTEYDLINWITEIEIRHYEFIPSYHFMIVNQRTAVLGTFQASEKVSCGLDPTSTFTLSKTDPEGEAVITELSRFFETIYSRKQMFPATTDQISNKVLQ